MSAPQVPNKYPSVDLAYQLAVQSYDLMVKRFDAMDARIQSTIGLVVSLTVAIPIAISTFALQYPPWLMRATVVVFLLAIILGICARFAGKISLVSPAELHRTWIQSPEEDFKREFIRHAGTHMDANARLLNKRYRLMCGVIFLLFLEALLFGVAVLGPHERAEPDQAGLEVVAEAPRSQQVLAVVDPALMNFHQIAGRHYLLILQSCANATPPRMVRQARRMRPASLL